MLQPLLLNQPMLVTPETAGPWITVSFFVLIAAFPRLLAWILNAPGRRSS